MKSTNETSKTSRREFVKQSSLMAGGLMAAPLVSNAGYFNSVDDTIKVAVIGCGGRGTGAAMQALLTKQNVKLVAMADAFRDRLDECFNALTSEDNEEGNVKAKVAVTEATKFVGFDGYMKAIPLAHVIILTTPPGFRPIQFAEAIQPGKHVFMQKPIATDPAGVKKVLETAENAKQKTLNAVIRLQRHYKNSYRELYKRAQDGMIGEITS